MRLMHIRQANSTTLVIVPETSMEENLLAGIAPRNHISTTVCEVVAPGALKPVTGPQVYFTDWTENQARPPAVEAEV